MRWKRHDERQKKRIIKKQTRWNEPPRIFEFFFKFFPFCEAGRRETCLDSVNDGSEKTGKWVGGDKRVEKNYKQKEEGKRKEKKEKIPLQQELVTLTLVAGGEKEKKPSGKGRRGTSQQKQQTNKKRHPHESHARGLGEDQKRRRQISQKRSPYGASKSRYMRDSSCGRTRCTMR